MTWVVRAWMPLMAAALACQGVVEPGPDPDARFGSILADSARANGVIGAQAVVLIPGQPPWSGVTGEERPGLPMVASRLIGTGSISKLYTAAAAMVQIDRGAFALEDTVGRWFPGLPNVPGSITVRQLLRHTSGLADLFDHPQYSSTVFADPSRVWTPAELLGFIQPPRFPPDQGWEASATNTLLLGMIVEQTSGLSLGGFLRSAVFRNPERYWLMGDGPPPSHLATQWFVDAQGARTDVTGTLFGPALFSSRREVQASAEGNAAFLAHLVDGDLLSPAMRSAMLTFVPSDGRIANETGGGFGIRRFVYFGRTMYGHSGGVINASAMMLYDPATRIVVAVSINQNGPSHRQSHFSTAAALMLEAIGEARP